MAKIIKMSEYRAKLALEKQNTPPRNRLPKPPTELDREISKALQMIWTNQVRDLPGNSASAQLADQRRDGPEFEEDET